MNANYYRLTEALEVWVKDSGQKAILMPGQVVWVFDGNAFCRGTELIADLQLLHKRSIEAPGNTLSGNLSN